MGLVDYVHEQKTGLCRKKDNRAPKNAFSVLDELLTADEDEEGQPELIEE